MKFYGCLIAAGLVLLVIMGCAAPLCEDTATATIAINGLTGSESSAGDGLLGAAPTGIQGVSVLVEGPGMPTLGAYYPGAPGSLELVVPAGSRTFTVTVYLDPALDSAVLAYGGKTTVTLAAGSSKTVNVDMSVYESKLVVPDYNNDRVVQLDDMNGSGWVNTGLRVVSAPSDVAFDRYGRFYVAQEGGGILRFDSISQAPTGINTSMYGGNLETITIDTLRDKIYFYQYDDSYSYVIYRYDLDGGGTLESRPVSYVKAMEYDPVTGFLYLAITGVSAEVWLYDYDNARVVKSYTLSSTRGGGDCTDVTLVGDYVYAILNGSTGEQIFRLSRDLTNPVGYGSQGLDGSKGTFYGAYKFAGRSQQRLCVIDEGDSYARLVSIQDITGKGWKTFGSYGSGINQFGFFLAF